MANPFYNALNGNNQPNIMQQFQQFMSQMKGQNPDQILNELISSGKINQQQLDAAQKQARQMQSMFDSMRGMFGM